MRILVAPTAFKGSFSPIAVAKAIAEGIAAFSNQYQDKIYVIMLPIADGGDGTVDSLALACEGTVHTLPVTGSCGENRTACWLELKDTAVVELASACGIAGLKKSELKPLEADTRGLGAVIKHVIETTNLKEIVIALGGSASTDGGSGALYELGVKFFDENNTEFVPAGGGSLKNLYRCNFSAAKQLTSGRQLRIATDVLNPLLGRNGAASIFGPQKGASEEDLEILEAGLSNFAEILEDNNGGLRSRDRKGAGAAGGTAFGLAAALGAPIISGFDWLSALLKLPEKIAESDLVITGEGQIDNSSLHGKVIGSIYNLCKKDDKAIWLIAGSISEHLQVRDLKADLVAGLTVHGSGQTASLEDIRQFTYESLRTKYLSKTEKGEEPFEV